MSTELLSGLIMCSLLLALAIGIPVAFSLIGVALIFALIVLGPGGAYLIMSASWHQISSEVMLAVPLFVLMAEVLEFSGIGSNLFESAHKWFGGLRGGLGVATVAACTVLAAITGLGATGVIIMGTLAIPEMRGRGYNKMLILGCVPAAAALGPIIPPSVYMIVIAVMAEQSVGKVFIGGVIPGLLISLLFCVYILTISYLRPAYAPGVPKEERASWKEKFLLLRHIILPGLLILSVLGAIYGGIATPTEAASIGVVGALIVSAIHRQLTWEKIKKATNSSLFLTILIMWIAIGGSLFAGVLTASGSANVVRNSIESLPLDKTGMLAVMLLIALGLGCIIDGLAIIMITIPIFVPVITALGVNPVLFVVLYSIAIVIGLISPPFGINLFFLKGIVPDVSIGDIYRAAIPFTIVMIIALFLCVLFPGLVMYLPDLMIR